MPPELKFDARRTKILLKRVAARHVPRDCVYRPKEGFSIPIKNWLKTELRGLANTYLEPARLRADGLFEPAEVERLWREHLGTAPTTATCSGRCWSSSIGASAGGRRMIRRDLPRSSRAASTSRHRRRHLWRRAGARSRAARPRAALVERNDFGSGSSGNITPVIIQYKPNKACVRRTKILSRTKVR